MTNAGRQSVELDIAPKKKNSKYDNKSSSSHDSIECGSNGVDIESKGRESGRSSESFPVIEGDMDFLNKTLSDDGITEEELMRRLTLFWSFIED